MDKIQLSPNNVLGKSLTAQQNNQIVTLLNSLKIGFENYISNIVRSEIINSSNNYKSRDDINSLKELPEYVTSKEACKILQISSTTLWRWSENGRINKYFVFGNPRFSRKELLEVVKSVEKIN